MMELLTRLPAAVWRMTEEMAPYLLLGFLTAGILSRHLPEASVRRWLGGGGWKAIFKATLVGIPMPLCSCGVLPVAASLRRSGASRPATAAFLVSTPQTGVDSIAATWGLMGPLLAVVRVLAALVTGLFCGFLVQWTKDRRTEAPPAAEAGCCGEGQGDTKTAYWHGVWQHGFVRMPLDLAIPLLVGLVLAGCIQVFLPIGFISQHTGPGWMLYPLVTLVAVPLYVCSTGSIPLAFSLMHGGLPAGAALVFLITGPATNTAALAASIRMLGWRGMAVSLLGLVAVAWSSGALLDLWLPGQTWVELFQHHHEGGGAWWQTVSALVLLGLLLAGLGARVAPLLPGRKSGCCQGS